MIFDIYEQGDLFLISNCRRRSTLEMWLRNNHIPFSYDAKGRVIAHKRAVEAGLGAAPEPEKKHEVELFLGDEYVTKRTA